MKNKAEQILSFAENELIDKESIRRAALHAAPAKQGKRVAWTKILLPIAASLVLLCGTVLAIPQARAEVFRWLHIERPEQYLTEDPETRTPNEAIDSLILPPEDDAPRKNRIISVDDAPIWQQIAEEFQIDLGETMYDGEQLYFTVTLHGLTALPEVDAYTGGSATQTRVPTEQIGEFWEDGKAPEEFTNGTMSFFEESMGQYFLRFADGTEINGMYVSALDANPDFMAALDRNYDEYGEDPLSDADREAISRDSIQWLSGSTLTGVVQFYAGDTIAVKQDGKTEIRNARDYLASQTDEHGILTAEVVYRAISTIPDETVHLEAELGTTRFNLNAVDSLEKTPLTAEHASVTFGPLPVTLTYTERIKTDYADRAFAAINLPADLNGVKMTLEDGAYIDGIGVHDIRIRFTLPNDWTDEMAAALLHTLNFEMEIDGKHYASSVGFKELDARTLEFSIDSSEFPYDRTDAIKTVRIIPELHAFNAMMVGDTRIPLKVNERLVEPENRENVQWTSDVVTLSDGILVLTKQN